MQFPPSPLRTPAPHAGRFPHPHSVAPFPPPPRSYATIRHGPVLPAPFSNLPQPFCRLAFTHLPPHAHPRPLPKPVPISLYPSSSGSMNPSPPPTRAANDLPTAPCMSQATRVSQSSRLRVYDSVGAAVLSSTHDVLGLGTALLS